VHWVLKDVKILIGVVHSEGDSAWEGQGGSARGVGTGVVLDGGEQGCALYPDNRQISV
jgi:hypothetical protein